MKLQKDVYKNLATLIRKSNIVACHMVVYSVDKKPGYSKLYFIQKVFISYNSSVSPQILDQSKLTVCDT